MSTDPQISPIAATTHPALRPVFPAAVVVVERRAPGESADLLPDEAHYVARSVPKRVREFAAGRACAREALATLGIRGFALRAAPDRQPVWPEDIIGSITHTTGFCAAVVARRSAVMAVGIDSEVVGAPTPDLWPTIADAEELNWVHSLPEPARAAALTLLFSAKEAFYKCQYPVAGEWLDFHDLHVDVPAWGAAAGSFSVFPARSLQFARRATVPWTGHFLFHEQFVSAGVTVPNQA